VYLSQHGVVASSSPDYEGYRIAGAHGTPRPWTDARGQKIGDLKVYWTYANRRDGEKGPFFVWNLRLSHYNPFGEMKFTGNQEKGGCDVTFRLYFGASGGDVIVIVPWGDTSMRYESNGRLEREYLDGIASELNRHGSAPLKR
jgi:hypothetical protein